MLPITVEFINQILDFEADAGFHVRIGALLNHRLQTILQIVQTYNRSLRFVLLLGFCRPLNLILLFLVIRRLFLNYGRRLLNWFRIWVRFLLSTLFRLINLESCQSVEHAAKDLDISPRKLLEELIEASFNDVSRDHVKLEKFDNQLHVSVHLVLLSHLQLVLVKNEKHLLVEVLLKIIFDKGFFHRGTPFSSVHLLALEHLIKLLLAACQKKFLEVHLCVLWIVEFFEKADAQFDVKVQKGSFRRRLHKNDFH